MAIVATDNAHYTAIAAAIRAQNGESITYRPADMATAILDIEGGGGRPTATRKEINFFDFDGTCLYSYNLSDLPLSKLPDAPDHSNHEVPLTFQGWNYTLDKINSSTRPKDIGATYIPTDGKTHLVIEISDIARNTAMLYWNQSTSNGIAINWGDGSPIETFTGTGNKNTTHTYIKDGEYNVTLHTTEGSLQLGWGATYCLMGDTGNYGRVYCNMLKRCYIGSGVSVLSNITFQRCYSLSLITIPAGVTSIGVSPTTSYVFQNCYGLSFITIPDGVTMIGGRAFESCYNLHSVIIPHGVTSLIGFTFSNCYNLSYIVIPDSVTGISGSTFPNCQSLSSIIISGGIADIKSSMFSNCYCISHITIPDSITNIDTSAFQNCFGVGEYRIKPTTPPTLVSTNVFSGIPLDCVMYVPMASLAAYKAATNWSSYANYMVGV